MNWVCVIAVTKMYAVVVECKPLFSFNPNRYTGELSEEAGLKKAVDGQDGGAKCPGYTGLVAWVTGELRVLANLEEMVNATSAPDEHSSFLMEVSSFLKELGGFFELCT